MYLYSCVFKDTPAQLSHSSCDHTFIHLFPENSPSEVIADDGIPEIMS